MLRSRVLLFPFVALALVLGSCSMIQVPNLVSVEQEWAMGVEFEKQLNAEHRLITDPVVNQYVTAMGMRMVQQTSMRELSWRFYVIEDPSVNAFNAPGGLVYVNTGLIAAVTESSELAAVVAHEIAHGLARHGTKRLSQAYGLSVLSQMVLGQNPGMVTQVAGQIATGGLMAGYSRADEFEADRLGVQLMAASGYHPEGMISMFGKLQAQQQRNPSSLERFFATHPPTPERINGARQTMQQMTLAASLVRNDADFARVKGRIR